MPVLRTLPDIVVRMISETSRAGTQGPPVRMIGYPFQHKGDQGKQNSIPEHHDVFQRHASHGLALLPLENRLLNNLALPPEQPGSEQQCQ
jgi:hypothetical protein